MCTTDTPTCSQIRAHAYTAGDFSHAQRIFGPSGKKTLTPLQKSIGKACIVHSKPWDKIESDCHVHLYPGVWVVVMENEIFKLELVNVSHLSLQFQTWERPRSTLELGDRNGGMTLFPS